MDRKGRPLMPNAVILNPDDIYSFNPAAACCRDRFLVAWQSGGLQAVMLHGDTISPPLLPRFGGLPLANLGYPSVTADDDSFVVGGSSGAGLILARFALSGTLVQTNHISLGDVGPFNLVKLPGRLLVVYTANGQTTNASIRGLQINARLEPDGDSFLIEDQVGWWGRATTVPTRHGEALAVIERNYYYTNSHVFTRRIRFDPSGKH
jgi:hypothetical protein